MFFGRRNKNTIPTSPFIAIVDDKQEICETLKDLLEKAGYTVQIANDGAAGWELITRQHPALLLLDIKMPRMNGYQLLTRIQQTPDLEYLPIIVMTGITADDSSSDEEWARKLGVTHFISKPMELDQVLELVRQQLEEKAEDEKNPDDLPEPESSQQKLENLEINDDLFTSDQDQK